LGCASGRNGLTRPRACDITTISREVRLSFACGPCAVVCIPPI
jgi:hypothetical protein